MTYITHDAPKTTSAVNVSGWFARAIGWMKALWNSPASRAAYPHSEHLLRDAGLTRTPSAGATEWQSRYALNDRRLYTPLGSNVTFADLQITDHLDHRAW